MPLAVTPVEAKLRDDRIEFGCPRSTRDNGGAAPLDAFSSLLPPYESSDWRFNQRFDFRSAAKSFLSMRYSRPGLVDLSVPS